MLYSTCFHEDCFTSFVYVYFLLSFFHLKQQVIEAQGITKYWSKVRGAWGIFATFAYSVIPELSCHLIPMVRKGKSLLFGHISRILKKSPFAAKKKFCR